MALSFNTTGSPYQQRRVAGVTGGDILFEDYHFSFKQQISKVNQLKEAVNKYSASLKETKVTLKNVTDCLADFYEDFWPQHNEFKLALKDSDAIWNLMTRYTHELQEPVRRFDQLGVEAEKYLIRTDTKLTEGSLINRVREHSTNLSPRFTEDLQSQLQRDSEERRDNLKNVNDEMVDDLAKLFEQRGGFVIDIFKSVFTAHYDFYSESAKVSKAILDMVTALENTKLEMSVGQGKHRRVVSTNKQRIGWRELNPASQPHKTATSGPPMPPVIGGTAYVAPKPTGGTLPGSVAVTPPDGFGVKANLPAGGAKGASLGGSAMNRFNASSGQNTPKPMSTSKKGPASSSFDMKNTSGLSQHPKRTPPPRFTNKPPSSSTAPSPSHPRSAFKTKNNSAISRGAKTNFAGGGKRPDGHGFGTKLTRDATGRIVL
ncbi:bridging integrator 2-like [Diadema setosum]|uniref:bridging integrator 2-like n=1 Tax=Diadema setosum TaxID=31175 RepID=UPI003B3B6B91